MSKEHMTTNTDSELNASTSNDLIANSVPPRIGPYRSLSAKRSRDPSHRKSVSFNDVPIVHEVPSFDTMRNANCDTYRSWTYADATTATSVVPSFYSSQILLPFNSASAAAQKVNANRLCSTLYSTTSSSSSSSTTSAAPTSTGAQAATTTATTAAPTNTTTTYGTNRMPEWAIRNKTSKSVSNSEETHATNETHSNGNPSVLVVHIPDEKTIKDTTIRPISQSTYNSVYIPQTHISSATAYNSSQILENVEDERHPYRSALVPDTDHYRSVPHNHTQLSDSTATYTSMLSTNLIQGTHASNEHFSPGYPRAARARSATLPGAANHSGTRANENISITPFRAATANLSANSSSSPTRTVLRPTTIAFQCSQPTTTNMNTTNSSSNITSVTAASNGINMNQSTTTANTTKSSTIPSRFGSSAAAVATAHSRFSLPSQRAPSASSLSSSPIKYNFAHPNMDSSLNTTMLSHATTSKPSATSYSRSRSAHVLSTRRTIASPVVMLDGHSAGGGTTNNPPSSLYATTKRNPNVRQTYGSYYMHRVLLPTTIH